jgi:hypothetical protein
MEVADVFELRERQELLPVQRDRIFDAALNLEVPLIEFDVGAHSKIQNREIVNAVLPRRQTAFRARFWRGFARHLLRPTLFCRNIRFFHPGRPTPTLKRGAIISTSLPDVKRTDAYYGGPKLLVRPGVPIVELFVSIELDGLGDGRGVRLERPRFVLLPLVVRAPVVTLAPELVLLLVPNPLDPAAVPLLAPLPVTTPPPAP